MKNILMIINMILILGIISNGMTQSSGYFTNIAHINTNGWARDVAVDSNGVIFVANSYDGIRAYNFNGSSFIDIAHANEFSNACAVAVGKNGQIFLGDYRDGLRAYFFDGSSLINKAYVNDCGRIIDIDVAMDGTVLVASQDSA